jgi:hypothetical protein
MERGTARPLGQSKRYSPRIGQATVQIGKCAQICLETCEVNKTDEIDVVQMMQYTKESEKKCLSGELSFKSQLVIRRTVVKAVVSPWGCISTGKSGVRWSNIMVE